MWYVRTMVCNECLFLEMGMADTVLFEYISKVNPALGKCTQMLNQTKITGAWPHYEDYTVLATCFIGRPSDIGKGTTE